MLDPKKFPGLSKEDIENLVRDVIVFGVYIIEVDPNTLTLKYIPYHKYMELQGLQLK